MSTEHVYATVTVHNRGSEEIRLHNHALGNWLDFTIKRNGAKDIMMAKNFIFADCVVPAGKSVSRDYEFDGIDLTGHLFQNESVPERNLFWDTGKSSAIRCGNWKLIQQDGKPKLFDLDNDLLTCTDMFRFNPSYSFCSHHH